jgi:hypothetical protein
MESDDAPIESIRQNDALNECAGTVAVANDDEIRLAVDSRRKQIVIDGLAPLTSPTEYRIVSVLVELFREGQKCGTCA